MTETTSQPIILNLAGALSEELSSYFAKNQFRVVDPMSESVLLQWTHILVRDLESFDAVGDTYGTLENDIKLVSLSQPRDLKNFMINNGKFVLDETWLTTNFGIFLLDKFFQEYGGVSLADNYPKFREYGTFNITNPFNTGEYLDHLVYNAFENGMSALSVKTYFDHLLMYLTSLKNKGRVGFPIEVSYGAYGDIYGVQMHFFSENMQIEDVTNSLTSSITKTPEEYLLYVSLQSSDFFDFTYLPEVNKVVITGLWSRDENVKTENKGLMFTTASAASEKDLPAMESASPFVINDGAIEDLSAFVSPAGEEAVAIIPAELPEGGEEVRIIPAYQEEEETVTKISGGPEEEDVSTTVKGSKEEEDKTVTKIAGKKEEKDDFKVTLSSSKEEKKGNMAVKSLGGAEAKGPGMFDFSNGTSSLQGAPAEGNKKAAALFKVSGPSKKEQELEKQFSEVLSQNEQLKSKLMTVMSELKVQKDTQAKVRKIADEASKVEVVDKGPTRAEAILAQNPSTAPSEREKQLAEEFKQLERESRKIQLEAVQKETRLEQEIEKLQRMNALKDNVVEKTKETLTKALSKKDEEIAAMKAKLEQVNKHMASGAGQANTQIVKELERQTQNQNKVIEMYKNKIATLSTAMESMKVSDTQKDDLRKYQLSTQQLQTQTEALKKEITRLQERQSSDTTQLMTLKQERAKLMDALKKSEQAAKAAQGNGPGQSGELEVKRLHAQVQQLENYLKESTTKVKDLEIKLQNAVAVNRSNVAAEDGQSKAKIGHLENSVKKLTQDLVESRNQLAEQKKDTNKLRQEKTALQNMLDKAKKDLEKLEKKPASGKKAS